MDYKIVNRPVAEVIREIKTLRTRHVMFIDDNLIGNPAWTWEFLTRAARPRTCPSSGTPP